jgi:hypothetical protein
MRAALQEAVSRHGGTSSLLLCALVALLGGCGDFSHASDGGLGWRASGGPPTTSDGPQAKPQGFTLVAMPDTQNVVSSYPEILYLQTAWIADQAEALGIRYVVNEGDITNDSADEQWQHADHAFRLLDDRVPYAVTVGNHDYPGSGHADSRNTRGFDREFPPDRAARQPGYGGAFEADSAVNAMYTFEAGGQEWLIFMLEFGPRDDVLSWVAAMLQTRPGAQAILVTHAYLFLDGSRFDHVNGTDQFSNPHDYNDDGRLGSVNDAEEMWRKLIADHAAIRLVLCGHMHGAARLTSPRTAGSPVHQMLADFQSEERGGAGYMRMLTFMPDGTIQVWTYSPFLDRYRTDDQNQFMLKL